MAYTSAYSAFPWEDRVVSNPMKFSVTGAVIGDIVLTPNEQPITKTGTAFTAGRMQQLENGLQSVAQAMVSAQQVKVTLDTGSEVLSISSGDFNAQVAGAAAGLTTFWCQANVTNNPAGANQLNGVVYKDSAGHGWVYANAYTTGQMYYNVIASSALYSPNWQRVIMSNTYNTTQTISAADFAFTCQGKGTLAVLGVSTAICDTSFAGGAKVRYNSNGSGISILVNDASAYAPIAASAFNVNSEREKKSNIKRLADTALNSVKATNVYEYDYDGAVEAGSKYSKKVGLILDEVPVELKGSDSGIDLYSMVSTLWKATQELSAKNDALEARLATLEAKVNA